MAGSPTTYAMKGRLTFSRSGWVILEVPNDIGNGAFKALSEHGIEQPISESLGRYNAHISVMRPDEVTAVGGPDMIKARGQSVGFNLGPVREISNPSGWDTVSKVWVIEVNSPELMKLRRSLGLGEPKHPFHITFAVRKKNAFKQASIIHFEKEAAQQTEIKQSPIEGKGLFATVEFKAGDVIIPHFMMLMLGDDNRNKWDQSEQCRFTNHSDESNCVIVRDGDYVKLVAERDIVKGEELTADYGTCEPVCGPDFDFTYRGKPYDGESSTQSVAGKVHPTSATILRTLAGGDPEQDADNRDDSARDSAGSDHNSAGDTPSVGPDQAGEIESASNTDSSGSQAGFDHHRRTKAAMELCQLLADGTAVRGFAGIPGVHEPAAGGVGLGGIDNRSGPDILRFSGTATRNSGPASIFDSGILKAAVNKNRIDYAERLKKLRTRRGECPGCGTTFKADEPYPGVNLCEVCERFGSPKLIKEGMALVTQIANARKATAAPTESQARAGNYPKGKFRMHGMQFTIETPKGGVRSGKDKNGKAWSNTMTADYGYINCTLGKDGDHVDVFVGPDPDAEMVFVVDQIDPDSGRFDEHKVMFGYKTETEAKAAYLAHYAADWQGLRDITALTMPQFRWWLDKGDQRKPVKGITVKTAADSFYLNAINQTPLNYDSQQGIVNNIVQHVGSIKARGDRAIDEAASLDRLQNAANPDRAMQQLSGYLSGKRPPLVSHPLDRLLTEIK